MKANKREEKKTVVTRTYRLRPVTPLESLDLPVAQGCLGPYSALENAPTPLKLLLRAVLDCGFGDQPLALLEGV